MFKKLGIGCLGIVVLPFVLLVLLVLANPGKPAGTASSAGTANPPPSAPAPAAPLVLTGTGKSVGGPFPLKSGLIRVAMKYTGDRAPSNFAVKLLDTDGKPAGGFMGVNSLLANEIGSWEGETAVRVEKTGSYLLDITANGPWTITITQ